MASVQEHYESFLAPNYSWMFGDYETRVRANAEFFREHNLLPHLSGRAIDLGCGSGFQSIALADLGFRVLGIDLSPTLVKELLARRGDRAIQTVQADILDLPAHCGDTTAELIVCMGDTLTHLESLDKVAALLDAVHRALQDGGSVAFTFRDLTGELRGTDRIIPVFSDDTRIMTTFLEYEGDHVNVHDTIYAKREAGWELAKSCYRKLRLGAEQVAGLLRGSGFVIECNEIQRGFVTIIASR